MLGGATQKTPTDKPQGQCLTNPTQPWVQDNLVQLRLAGVGVRCIYPPAGHRAEGHI